MLAGSACGRPARCSVESGGCRRQGPSAAAIASLLTRCIGGNAGRQARERFADALALNWLLAGSDAHAKNYSLLLSGHQVRLATLYDVASALPYTAFYPGTFTMATRIGGQYLGSRVSADRWRRAAAQLDLDEDALLRRVGELARRLPLALAKAAAEPAVAVLDSSLPERLQALVAARCLTLVVTWNDRPVRGGDRGCRPSLRFTGAARGPSRRAGRPDPAAR